jgi:protein-L-isoaspartate(D-aspartate) O-methyltransferase
MEELVKKLRGDGVLHSKNIIEAFLAVDRKGFVPTGLLDDAYADVPLPIGSGQTISQPYTVAFMLELLLPDKGQKVLDVGFGSGWSTALLAHLVGEAGRVYALEIVPEVFEFGSANLQRRFARGQTRTERRPARTDYVEIGNIKLHNRSGRMGLREHAPFDRILVSAAGTEEPAELKNQLAPGGRIVIPIQESIRLLVKKSDGGFERKDYHGFAFVPLVR